MARNLNGKTVREMRHALGIRHADFCTDVRVSPGYLSNIESGRKQPAADVVKRMADRLGVSVDAITYPVADDEQVPA